MGLDLITSTRDITFMEPVRPKSSNLPIPKDLQHWRKVARGLEHWFFESASTWDQNRYGDYPLTKNGLKARLNESYLYVSYSGHANRKNWFFAEGYIFNRSDALKLTNAFPFINLPRGCGT